MTQIGEPKSKKALIEQRRRIVAANLLAGLNYRDIATGLNVSLGTIARDVKILFERWRKEQVQTIDEQKDIDLRRIDVAINAIWDEVKNGHLGAIDRMDKLLQRRSRMLGYDAPETIKVKHVPDDVKEMTDDELAAIAAGNIKPTGGK